MRRLCPFFLFLLLCSVGPFGAAAQEQNTRKPVPIAVVGLTHTHVHGILGRKDKGDLKIVGIVEPDKELARRYLTQYGISMDLLFPTMDALLARVKPVAVLAFNTIYQHLEVVQRCAPLGIHVMVEKPLAVSLDHARQMEALARQYKIQLLTNYETTWYASNHKAYELLHGDKALGPVRKVVVHDGHQGPKEIGVNKEFLDWLTDPVQNGGGAITDFGCYGANLITWLMKGERPLSVTAITQQIKPEVYPKVDDEATILLTYPSAQGIIQASWNWPYSRKDMEVYGKTGYVLADNGNTIRYRLQERDAEKKESVPARTYPLDDPYGYFVGVIRGDVVEEPFGLSSLENNMVVMEILEAGKRSAREGRRIQLSEMKPAATGQK